jgi:hypothetical protein
VTAQSANGFKITIAAATDNDFGRADRTDRGRAIALESLDLNFFIDNNAL